MNDRGALGRRVNRNHSIRRSFKGSKSGGPQLWAQQQRGKMGGCGVSSGTQRDLIEEFAGSALKSMGMSRCFERGCQKGVRQDGHEVLCAERAVVTASVADRAKHSSRRGTNHALACRSLHVANSTSAGSGGSPTRKGTENCRRGRPQSEKADAPDW